LTPPLLDLMFELKGAHNPLKQIRPISLALLASLLLSLLAALVSDGIAWGINHLAFAPSPVIVTAGLVGIFTITLLLSGLRLNWLDRHAKRISEAIFDSGPGPKIGIAALSLLIFWLLRANVHFLGDGYGMIALYGQGETVAYKWTSLGPIWILRQLQTLLGAYTNESSRTALQIMSVLSGALYVWLSVELTRYLATGPVRRLVTLATLWLSGVSVMWFGYTELYGPFWVCAMLFMVTGARWLASGRGLTWVVVALALSLLMHLQAVYLIPGALILLLAKSRASRTGLQLKRSHTVLVIGALAAGTIAFFYLYQTRLTFEIMFLPPFVGRPHYPSYAVFSPEHLIDIANLLLVVAPGLLVLVAGAKWAVFRRRFDLFDQVLLMTGACSLVFLLIVDPRLGIGRDWDLLAFTIIPWLLLLCRHQQSTWENRPSFVVAYTLLLMITTGAYATSNLHRPAAEMRYAALLENYGAKNRAGWVILANYYRDRGQTAKHNRIAERMRTVFPQDALLEQAYAALESGRLATAYRLADSLYRLDRFNADYLQILGNTEGKRGDFRRAVVLYEQAISLKPFNTMLRNEYCQLFLTNQQYDKALTCFQELRHFDPHTTQVAEGLALTYIRTGNSNAAWSLADSLSQDDPSYAGASLIKLVVSLAKGDQYSAAEYYSHFRQYGVTRSDYERIIEHYKFLDTIRLEIE